MFHELFLVWFHLSSWRRKHKGLGEEEGTESPGVGLANSQENLCFSMGWKKQNNNITFPLRRSHESNVSSSCVDNEPTTSCSLFSASKFIEKRHCFFKIALASPRRLCPLLGEQKASWDWYTGAGDESRISSVDQLQSASSKSPTGRERILPDMGKNLLPPESNFINLSHAEKTSYNQNCSFFLVVSDCLLR